MKRASLILLVVAAVFALGSCDWFGSDLSPEEINAALAVAATQIGWMEMGPPTSVFSHQSAVAVPRVAFPVIDGPEGGTATFVIDSWEPLSGTITFAGFAFAVDSGDEYVLDGSIDVTFEFFVDDADLTATFSGTLAIGKNGETAEEYVIEVTQAIGISENWEEPGSITVTLTVTTTGTINGESAAGELGFSYTWPVEMPL